MDTPLISIILPTHNGSKFITDAIESVRSQTYIHWELIVLNDASMDNTRKIVEDFCLIDLRIVLVENEKNLGIQKTLNRGIQISKGKYIARIDDDDRWVSVTKLAEQVSFLESHPDYILVGTDATVVDVAGEVLSVNTMPKTDQAIRLKILSRNCFLHSTIMARKSIIEKVGGYKEDTAALHAEDYDLWLRMGLGGKMANLKLRSTVLTAHPSSLSYRNRILQAKNILSIVRQYKNKYPNFFSGYAISYIRYIGFSIAKVVPVPKGLFYATQRLYRSI